MVQRASSSEEDVIDLPMSRQEMADYLGLTIETVSRTLWDFERSGAIETLRPTGITCSGSGATRPSSPTALTLIRCEPYDAPNR